MPAVLDSYVAEAERLGSSRRAADPEWLTRVRGDGLAQFQTLGFPTTKDEDWRFTSVARVADGHFALAKDDLPSLVPEDLAACGWRGHARIRQGPLRRRGLRCRPTPGRRPRRESRPRTHGRRSGGRSRSIDADRHRRTTRVYGVEHGVSLRRRVDPHSRFHGGRR